ncbi:MAG: gamma-glutamyltransferase [Rhodobacteraceae bacterium]|nr:gamma-glutamyltransferase [Paracoccaceae bacterium]
MNAAVQFTPAGHLTQNWDLRKPGVTGGDGVVVAQSLEAASAGCGILSDGGTAADAAVATALALAVCEPWNSGLGGVGYGVVRAPDGSTASLDFGPVSPRRAGPGTFNLAGEQSGDIFGWPRVVDDANVQGPLSMLAPTSLAGLGLLHERYGRLPWADVVAPAIALARRGMARDWFSTVKIAQMAHYLRRHPESAAIYLPDGLPPVGAEQGNPTFLRQGALADTLARLADDGWRSLYEGPLAQLLLEDLEEVGALIDAQDLRHVEARLSPATLHNWQGHRLFLPPSETAAEQLPTVLDLLSMPGARDADWFAALATALLSAVAQRRNEADTTNTGPETCTSHLNVCDGEGMVISLTNTLLGLMGSAVVLPRTGILMNNGMMWFDPRPGRSNSVAPGRRPVSNMLPMIAELADGRIIALGASGGRRILPAVTGALCDMALHGMSAAESAHAPRIDVSSPGVVVADRRLSRDVVERLAGIADLRVVEHATAPLNFGCPSILVIAGGVASGQPDVMTPWSAAIAAAAKE